MQPLHHRFRILSPAPDPLACRIQGVYEQAALDGSPHLPRRPPHSLHTLGQYRKVPILTLHSRLQRKTAIALNLIGPRSQHPLAPDRCPVRQAPLHHRASALVISHLRW